jgi:carboxylate-amine ligase
MEKLTRASWIALTMASRSQTRQHAERAVDAAIARGAALDAASVYFFARLSPSFPTVEIRIADTCLTVDDAVLLAGLCRALVATATRETFDDVPYVDVPEQAIGAAAFAAARLGLDGQLVSPLSGRPAPGMQVLRDLVQHVTPALDRAGDSQAVDGLLQQRLLRGSGAALQAAWLWQLPRDEFFRRLAQETLAEEWQVGAATGATAPTAPA